MKIYGTENNETVLREIGRRIKDARISSGLKQSELAERAGISLATLIRIEKGNTARSDYLINILRALNCLSNIELLIAEQDTLPSDLFDNTGKKQRVRKTRPDRPNSWKWGDE